MSDEFPGLNGLPEPINKLVRPYAELVRQIAGPKAQALTLFGAVVSGTFDPNRHSVQNVLILDTVDLDILQNLAKHGVKLGKARITAPLIMTPAYIQASLDTFALEFIEIQQHYLTIFGEDYFADLAFDPDHVRLQCERELKVVLIGLRQGLLAAAGRTRFLQALETGTAQSLIRTLRGLLWLKDLREARPADQVLDEIEKITDRRLPGIRIVLDPLAAHEWNEFQSLYHDVEVLGNIADAW